MTIEEGSQALELLDLDAVTACVSNEKESGRTDSSFQWFAMRDLTRPNAKRPAYKIMEEKGIRWFTPMVNKIVVKNRKREREKIPYIHDLLFVYDTRENLDPIVAKIPTFQYRFLRHTNREPMTVRVKEMETFIKAVESSDDPQYYRPEDITPEMRRRKIQIIGGNLDGYEGCLHTVRGSRVKRLLVELPTLLAASVEVEPEFIQFIR